MRVLLVTGKRSEVIKMAPVFEALKAVGITPITLDVSQHKGWLMKGSLYLELRYPKPNYNIKYEKNVDYGISHIITQLKEIIIKDVPDAVIAAGASETTLAAAESSNELKIPFLHVESGYRSRIPESNGEMNRQMIDRLSSFLYAPTEKACSNLLMEEVPKDRFLKVGSTLIDSLTRFLPFSKKHSEILEELGISEQEYLLLTLHKRENISQDKLAHLLKGIKELDHTTVFPVHPVTRQAMKAYTLYDNFSGLENLLLTEPLDYIDFLKLEESSRLIMTDSGEVCEEATFHEKPLLILGDFPERLEPIESGTALTSPMESASILNNLAKLMETDLRDKHVKFIFGEGDASKKIADHLRKGEIDRLAKPSTSQGR
ncbi:MAG: UDP-N-acetylglucosamine 2-epimerase (non-hydrolyzing) [Nitrososphaeria archaeon]|nr:UDP-N-acetylglucosamine 2-epimerase (non-hydrolyzing) [Nitrososphaeria archaeon]NIQ32352.1 UDP-N-acetylglucosamine 2-epimerase (non-hydrolyzing) [Nitrososphaeria archaeon]